MFVVLGATGNTGKVVAETLLSEKKPTRLVVRDPTKVAALAARGAEVVTADLDDEKALTAALRGAEGAYVLLPNPPFQDTGILASRAKLVATIAAAIEASGIKHVVFLSSIGGQHATGTGVIQTLYNGEQVLGKLSASVTFVRAAYFMENWLGMLQPVTKDSVLPAFFSPDKKIPMVATQDIGKTAAHALLEGGHGKSVIELSGPEDLSISDVAAIFGKLLGKTVNVFPVPGPGRIPALTGVGMGPELAELFVGLDDGIDSGAVDFEGGSAKRVHGTVTLESFLGGVLKASAAAP